MINVRERVDRLIAVATDKATAVEEARTAAMVAVRLIAEHRLLDVVAPAPDPIEELRRAVSNSRASVREASVASDSFMNAIHKAAEQIRNEIPGARGRHLWTCVEDSGGIVRKYICAKCLRRTTVHGADQSAGLALEITPCPA